jgi:hypothetical protein
MNTPRTAHQGRRHPLFRSLTALALSASILLSGCVSLRSVAIPAPGQSVAVKAGDKVQVRTRAGETLSFEVAVVESDALVGRAPRAGTIVRVKYLDIDTLQVEKPDKTRTALLVTGIIVALAAGVLIASGPPDIGPLFASGAP